MDKSTESADNSGSSITTTTTVSTSNSSGGGISTLDAATTPTTLPPTTLLPKQAQQHQQQKTHCGNITHSSSSSSSSNSNNSSSNKGNSIGCGPAPAASAASVTVARSNSQIHTTNTTTPISAVNGSNNNNNSISTPTTSASASASTIVAGTPRRFIISAIPPPLGAPALPLPQHTINLNVSTTTGGNFGVTVDPQISVENLKKIIAKKLKVAKDRICLLHREKELQDGILKDYNLMDGSKIILIPNVETGLLAQRPENTVMQALESLNDSQVNDFLSGKTPLNLSMRLGDHMMLIQLQLSTVNPINGNAATTNGSSSSSSNNGDSSSSSRSQRLSGQRSSRTANGGSAVISAGNHHSHHHHHHHHHHATVAAAATNLSSSTSGASASATTSSSIVRKIEAERVNIIHRTKTTTSIAAASVPSIGTTSSSGAQKRPYEQHYQSLQSIVNRIAMTRSSNRLASSAAAVPQALQQAELTHTHRHPASTVANTNSRPTTSGYHNSSEAALLEQSPIKSLSNLVSSPIKTTAIKHIPISTGSSGSSSSSSTCSSISAASQSSVSTSAQLSNGVVVPVTSTLAGAAAAAPCQDPIAAKLTSCLCTRLNGTGSSLSQNALSSKSCVESACMLRQELVVANRSPLHTVLTSTSKSSASSTAAATDSALHKTANNPIARLKHRHHHHHHHHHHHYHHQSAGSMPATAPTTNSTSSAVVVRSKGPSSPRSSSAASNDSDFASSESALSTFTKSNVASMLPLAAHNTSSSSSSSLSSSSSSSSISSSTELDESGTVVSDTRTLAEASRNLTQTLRKLSKEVFTNKIDLTSADDNARKSGSGAVIESMKNHGKGIYSGTFSGTLNPALQDRYGRPKRDISTVIHILNDLLSATPQYSRGARISFEANPSSAGTSTIAAAAATNGGVFSRSKQLSAKHHQHSQSCVKCLKSIAASAHNHQHNSSSSVACAYGECNGHYVSKLQACKQSCGQDLSANGSHSTATDATSLTVNDRNVCTCRYRVVSETGEREREHTCHKCLADIDNRKTKSKLDQLRLVMQQRKQKREARKLKLTPYGARVVGTTSAAGVADAAATLAAAVSSDAGSTTLSSSATAAASSAAISSGPTTPPSEVSPNHNIVEEVDTAA